MRLSCKLGMHESIDDTDIIDNGHFIIEKCIHCKKKLLFQIKNHRGLERRIEIIIPNRLKHHFTNVVEKEGVENE